MENADSRPARAGRVNAGRTARARAREQLTGEIKEAARRQLAAEGAQRLSLRAVARELGMVSSALYRYFSSRDDLLTALIIDAYNALGAAAEDAVGQVSPADARGRWRACAGAVRTWALAHPHEYALIYGSPVPGYRAPETTIAPAGRVARVGGTIVADAWKASAETLPAPQPLPGRLAAQADVLAAIMSPGVPAPVAARTLIAWTQLFGMVSFELFGQLVGIADPADDFFAYAVDQMADLIGLPPS